MSTTNSRIEVAAGPTRAIFFAGVNLPAISSHTADRGPEGHGGLFENEELLLQGEELGSERDFRLARAVQVDLDVECDLAGPSPTS